MATVYSGQHWTGSYTYTRVRVDYDYSTRKATATLLYSRTNSYSGETSIYGGWFYFGGAGVGFDAVNYGQKTDVAVASVSFNISLGGGTYTGGCDNGAYYGNSASVSIPAATSSITYHANGGSGAPGAHSYTNADSGTINLQSGTPTRTGYDFLGWSLSNTTTSASYSAGQPWNKNNYGNYNLYAVWRIKTFTVTIRRGTGISDITSPAWGWTGNYKTSTVNYGTSLTINASMSTGYHWSKWSGSFSTTTQKYTFTVTSNIDVTANAAANTYTVNYNANGGSGTTGSSSHTYGVAKNLTANGFSRTGYTFLGWSTSSSATSATYSNQQSVTNLTSTNGGTVTLYAVWKIITYTVSYDANGGSGAPSSQTKNHGSTLTLSSTRPTKTDTTANGYTVTFDGNGGTASKTSATATDTTKYTFLNWNTNKNNSGTTYSAGGSYTANSNATLYAQWGSSLTRGSIAAATITRPDVTSTRTVTFDTQGGICLTTSLKSTSTIKYTFNGWYSSKTGGTKKADGGATVTPTGTETWYAQYTQSGGTYSAITLPAVARDGYKFKGWSTDASASSGIMDSSYVPTANETLYAIWEEVSTSDSGPDIYVKVNGKWRKVVQTLTKANGEWIG